MAILYDPCAYDGCATPGPHAGEICEVCTLKHCAYHDEHHPCRTLLSDEDRGQLKFTRIVAGRTSSLGVLPNVLAIKQHAMSLRGKTCRVDYSAKKLGGGINEHWSIVFDDGVQWLLRQKLGDHEREFHPIAFRAEYDAIQALRKIHPALVPNAWLGDGYLFLERVPGASLEVDQEKVKKCWDDPYFPCAVASDDIYLEIASFYIKIASHPFDGIGSPAEAGLGPVVSFRSSIRVSGPFQNLQEYHLAQIDNSIAYGLEFGASKRMMLAYLDLRALVAACEEMTHGPTYLMNDDSKCDIFITESGKLTGVVDWELTRTGPVFEAFACPSGLDKEKLANAYSALGRPDLAKMAAADQKYSRLNFFITMGGYWFDDSKRCGKEMSEILALFAVSEPTDTAAEWEVAAYERHKNSPLLQALQSRPNDWAVKKNQMTKGGMRYLHGYYRAFLQKCVGTWERSDLRKKEDVRLSYLETSSQ